MLAKPGSVEYNMLISNKTNIEIYTVYAEGND